MYRILYVDDDSNLLELGKCFLECDETLSVDTSLSAGDALIRLKSTEYDAIVSDYQMPEMDGIIFLKTLREEGNTIPFIIFTGKGREEVVMEALNSGADFYLQKGGDPEPQFAELTHKIHHAISRRKADLALKKSERDYRNLIEHAGEAIFVIQDELLRLINPRAIELSGYSEQELLNQSFTRFVYPDDRDGLVDAFRRRSVGSNIPSHYTFRILRKDGTIRWVDLNVVAITWNEGPAILNFLTDITDRKRTEDALKESEERYHNFFETMPDSVFITTPEGRFIDFNNALMDTFGFSSREETFGTGIGSIYVQPEDRAAFLRFVEQNGYIKEYSHQFRKRDGTIFDALVSIVPQKNTDGSVKAFLGTIHDITSRKRAEDALRESEEKFRSLVDYTREGIFILNLQGKILFVNHAAASLLESDTCTGLIGRNVMEFIAPESRNEVMKDFEQVASGHDGYPASYHVITLKGKNIFVESIGKVINYEGKPADLVTIRDITLQKKTENVLTIREDLRSTQSQS